MKIINLPRGYGKTIRLIYASEFNEIPVLCVNQVNKEALLKQAARLHLDIPEPIIIADIISGKLRGSGIIDKDILIDDAPWVLQSLLKCLGMTGNIRAITLTEKE